MDGPQTESALEHKCRLHEYELTVERMQKLTREPQLKVMLEAHNRLENLTLEQAIQLERIDKLTSQVEKLI